MRVTAKYKITAKALLYTKRLFNELHNFQRLISWKWSVMNIGDRWVDALGCVEEGGFHS